MFRCIKLHAVVARHTFNLQVKMLKIKKRRFWSTFCSSCTPLWREAHFQVKMHKTPGFWNTFEHWMSHMLN